MKLFLVSIALLAAQCAIAAPDPQALLTASDHARGGGFPGLTWDVRTTNSGDDGDGDITLLRVKANEGASLAEILEPIRSRGLRVLQVQRNMWITKPGLKKPVAISARQRLTGQAALGDISATAYARDYVARYLRQEDIDGEPCHVLDLTAARANTTYDRITYWVSARRQVAVRADFMSVSGKRLKRAEFVYGSKITVDGVAQLFVSRMTIHDELTSARTLLDFSNVRVQPIPSSEFDLAALQ